jgi:hypothetical protein
MNKDEIPKTVMNTKIRARPRSRWEKQVRKGVVQKRERTWEKIEEGKVLEGRGRWIRFVFREPT